MLHSLLPHFTLSSLQMLQLCLLRQMLFIPLQMLHNMPRFSLLLLHSLFSLSFNFLRLCPLQTSEMFISLQSQMRVAVLSLQSEMLFTKDYL